MERVIDNPERDTNLLSETLIETPQQRTPTYEVDSVADNVSIELGWCLLQCTLNG